MAMQNTLEDNKVRLDLIKQELTASKEEVYDLKLKMNMLIHEKSMMMEQIERYDVKMNDA